MIIRGPLTYRCAQQLVSSGKPLVYPYPHRMAHWIPAPGEVVLVPNGAAYQVILKDVPWQPLLTIHPRQRWTIHDFWEKLPRRQHRTAIFVINWLTPAVIRRRDRKGYCHVLIRTFQEYPGNLVRMRVRGEFQVNRLGWFPREYLVAHPQLWEQWKRNMAMARARLAAHRAVEAIRPQLNAYLQYIDSVMRSSPRRVLFFVGKNLMRFALERTISVSFPRGRQEVIDVYKLHIWDRWYTRMEVITLPLPQARLKPLAWYNPHVVLKSTSRLKEFFEALPHEQDKLALAVLSSFTS